MILKKDSMTKVERPQMRGGNGTVELMDLVNPSDLSHSRLLSQITLNPGCSIGDHEHIKETEYYWIITGEGIVSEANGESTVHSGDVVVTGDGETHAIRNSGKTPLIFLALILLDD